MEGTIITLTDDDVVKIVESSSDQPSKQTVILKKLLEICSDLRHAQTDSENNIIIDLLHVTSDLKIDTLRKNLKIIRLDNGKKKFCIMESSFSLKIYTSDQLLRVTRPGHVNHFFDLLAILLQKQVSKLIDKNLFFSC